MSMLSIFFLVLGIILLVMLLMSIGMLFQKKALKGSCGGMNAILSENREGDTSCHICGRSDSRK